MEKEEKKETLTTLWMASNLEHKQLNEMLRNMDSKVKKEPTIAEVNNDWKRLSSFIKGKK